MLKRFMHDEQGQDVIEWGLLAAFLGIGVLGAAYFTGIPAIILGWYNDVKANIVNN